MNARRYVLGAGLALGGILWAVYGALTMLTPWGEEVRYSEDRGYSIVTDDSLFVGYNGPGAAALLLTTVAMLALAGRLGTGPRRAAAASTVCLWIAVVLAMLTAVGVVILSDPLFTAGRVFGAFFLGLAMVLLGWATAPDGSASGRWIATTGALMVGLLPLWPLVYAVRVVPAWGGAAYFGVLGLACLAVAARAGSRSGTDPGVNAPREPATAARPPRRQPAAPRASAWGPSRRRG